MMDPPCSRPVLIEHYRDVLDSAAQMFRARVEGTLARCAIGIPEVRVGRKVIQKGVPPDKTMLIFLLKARYGYRDSQRHEITGLENLDISRLTDAQLNRIIERIAGRRRTDSVEGGVGEASGPEVGKVH